MGLKMNYSTYISKQSRKPTGIFGRFVMSFFFEMGNVELNTLVYKALSVEKNDHALEIGFGPGALIKKIAERLDNGIIEGIDLSKSMVATAQKKNRKHINNGKVQIHLGDFDAVVFEDNCLFCQYPSLVFKTLPNNFFTPIFPSRLNIKKMAAR